MTGCPDKFGKFTVVTSRANIRNGATVTWRSVSFESPAESPIRNVPPGMPVRGAGCADTGTVARKNTKTTNIRIIVLPFAFAFAEFIVHW